MKSKVLILSNHPDYTYNFRKEIIYELLKENFKVIVSSPYGEKIDLLVERGVVFESNSIDRRGRNILKEIKLMFEFVQLMKKYRPDVIISYTIKPNIYGSILSKIYRIPIISNVTGLGSASNSNNISENIIKRIYKTVFKNNHTIFVQNTSNRDYFLNNNIKAENIKLIPGSGVNLDEFQVKAYELSDKINILYSGRLLKDKGVVELFEAIKILKNNNNIKFTLIGFIDDDIQREIEDMKNCNNFEYLGQQNDVMPHIENASCIILPSYHEGMSNSLLEAAAIGRPLLATNIPGCKEIIDDGVNGFLFEPKNIESLVDTIIKFSNLPYEARKIMGTNSRIKVENEFDRNIVVKNYLDTIKEITGEENERLKN